MSNQKLDDNKRIAKNTLLLYVRMLFNLIVTLYTSRVILQALGVEDMGIYNVVGGIVTMSQVVTSSISNAISRFLTFELGKGNIEKLRETFSTSVTVLIMLSVIIFLVAEFGGLYFVNEVLNISDNRIVAARYVLLFSALTFCVNMISVPYNASIISHEKMDIYAYVGIFEVVMKLVVAYAIMIFASVDKLILYAILLFGVSLVIRAFYGIYCGKSFQECKFYFGWNRSIFKELLSFSSWNFLENLANVFKSQGVSMLVNVFFGVTINAAQAIANQVSNAIQQFSNNFVTAVTPQIIKSYAEGNIEEMLKLTNKASRFSFYITLLIGFPIASNLIWILNLWLHTVPDYTGSFILLIILWILFEVLSQPVLKIIIATGKIRKYQIGISVIMFANFPLSYISLKLGLGPDSIYVVSVVTCFMAMIYRILTIKRLLPQINFKSFCYGLLYQPLGLLVCTILMYYVLRELYVTPSFMQALTSIFMEMALVVLILFWGMSLSERNFIQNILISKIRKWIR